ncbi:hypothetical protein GCM10010502_23420 [Kitasatospora aureofaciens]|uniref:Uncharacterized protein n=1 Tax=Kitasatospora aureofaciens TaxID=1894 RepID=A0A8H9HKA3_KITAU|nr:hypothetical protein GCM10010502_23420 [Kitasatospora aureofaciens]
MGDLSGPPGPVTVGRQFPHHTAPARSPSSQCTRPGSSTRCWWPNDAVVRARRRPGDDRRVAVEHTASTVLAALDQVHGECVAGLLYGPGARPRRTWPNQPAGSVNAA